MLDGSSGFNKGQPGFVAAALRASCPQCGSRTLFAGSVHLANACSDCGLNITAFQHGGGRAGALVALVVAALLTGLAISLDAILALPFWVHVVVWVPTTPLAVIYALRTSMAARIGMAYRRQNFGG